VSNFVTLVIAGAVSGALYSLIAAGLVVSYSATGIFNLGYGAVTFTSAFLYYELHSGLGWPVAGAAILTICVFSPLLGLALDRAVFRNLTRASESAKVMATVGILIALPAFALWLVNILVSTAGVNIPTGNQVYLAPGIGPSPAKVFKLGDGIILTSNQVIVFGFAAFCAVVLWWLMRRTSLGLRMRAVVDRPELAQMRGIDRGRTSGTAWVVGTTLAGVVGVVGSPIFNSLDPNTYNLIMFAAIAAAVIGGLRSVPLAFAGGILLGIVQNLVSGYATFAASIQGINASVPFVVILIGLFFLGRVRGRRAGTLVDEPPPKDFGVIRPLWRQALPFVIGLGLVLVFVEFLASSYYVVLTAEGLAIALIFLSYTIVTGIGGLVSLAQAAFVTGSGLVTGLVMDRLGLPWLIALLCGVVFAVLLGVVVAVPALRLGGLSFALASLALGFLGEQVLFVWPTMKNGQSGWNISVPFGLSDLKTMAVVLVIIIVLVSLGIRSLRNSPTGRAALAVRASEPAASSSGISIPAAKLWIFAISAGLAGLGGFLLVSVQASANNESFTTSVGLLWIANVVLWGVRRSGAAIIAGLSASVFPGLLISGFHWWSWVPSWLAWNGTKNEWIPQILFGLGAVQMAKDPDGILAFFGEGHRKRLRKSIRRTVEAGAVARDETSVMVSDGGPLPKAGFEIKDSGVEVPPTEVVAPNDNVVLSFEGIWAGYGDVTVLRDITLTLGRGSVTALVGANGAGKSTLAAVVSGMVAIQRGTLRYEDREINQEPAFRRARAGIIIAPEARGIFPGLSVEENLTVRLPHAEDRNEVYEQFPILGERRKSPAGALSGGEQQMLTLGGTLVNPPKLVVLDEPTLGLAPLIVDQVLNIIRLLRDRGVAVLLIEEKARSVMEVADYVAFLELGRLAWFGLRDQVDEEQLASAFLGSEGAKLIIEAETAAHT
jgi:ABC-type branched-subunit amino acid transport system ATPase component/branched-subunit amino acid ABC-type transport system permease component